MNRGASPAQRGRRGRLLGLELGHEHVTAPGLRLDVSRRVEIVAQSHSDFSNEDLDVVWMDVRIWPDGGHDGRFRQPGTPALDQAIQKS